MRRGATRRTATCRIGMDRREARSSRRSGGPFRTIRMTDNKNWILAIMLSLAVLFAWQYFVLAPMQRDRPRVSVEQSQRPGAPAETPAAPAATPGPQTAPTPAAPAAAPVVPRETVLGATPRLAIDTPDLKGSINLKGGRIDDLALKRYRETVSPSSPNIVLLSPSGSPHPYYAEFGWTRPAGSETAVPGSDTVWTVQEGQTLTPNTPVTLAWDNGQGLVFRRTIAVDPTYMFTVRQEVENRSGAPVTLYPYALISRHGTPETQGYYILHEGMIGYLGDGLREVTYKDLAEKRTMPYKGTGGWLGITDKYWATALIPPQTAAYDAKFSESQTGTRNDYQADYMLPAVTVAPGAKADVTNR